MLVTPLVWLWKNFKIILYHCKYSSNGRIGLIILTQTTSFFRTSMILIFLSLQEVTILLPLLFHETDWIRSGWHSISMAASPLSKFQITILGSKLALSRTLDATGCHRIWCTFLWWENPSRLNKGSHLSTLPRPSSSICQILTVVSSDDEATILSSKGFQATSNTSCVWPATRPCSGSKRPT